MRGEQLDWSQSKVFLVSMLLHVRLVSKVIFCEQLCQYTSTSTASPSRNGRVHVAVCLFLIMQILQLSYQWKTSYNVITLLLQPSRHCAQDEFLLCV